MVDVVGVVLVVVVVVVVMGVVPGVLALRLLAHNCTISAAE